MEALTNQALATLLLSLRIVPTFAFAPPFTFMRVPASVRLVLAVSLAAWLVAAHPGETWQSNFREVGLIATALPELLMGVTFALSLQIAFAALLTAGRTVDIQAGYGLAALIDPTTRAPLPLVGTLFAYAAGAVFFAIGAPADLLAIWDNAVAQVPLGAAGVGTNVPLLGAYMSAVFLMAFGAAGLIILVLFVIDLAIAFMSRTMPQMNVLLLGFQVKTIATLMVLPVAIALSIALYVRMLRFALQTAAELV
jgi:flagellar biosynthetic protein FliR